MNQTSPPDVLKIAVAGAEFASGYLALGAEVTLVSSRDRVLRPSASLYGRIARANALLEDEELSA